MIPKIIFQTYENSYIDLEKHEKINSSSWVKLNPDYEYIYMGSLERDYYVKKLCPELYQLYKESSGMYQSDLWRYIMLYNYGGVYADMDSVCIKSLDMLFDRFPEDELFCSAIDINQYDGSSFVNNANFASVKNSIYIKLTIDQFIEEYKNYLKDPNKPNQPYLPRNTIFSEYILKNINKVNFNMNEISLHSSELKTSSSYLTNNYNLINFYGNQISFENLLKLHKNDFVLKNNNRILNDREI